MLVNDDYLRMIIIFIICRRSASSQKLVFISFILCLMCVCAKKISKSETNREKERERYQLLQIQHTHLQKIILKWNVEKNEPYIFDIHVWNFNQKKISNDSCIHMMTRYANTSVFSFHYFSFLLYFLFAATKWTILMGEKSWKKIHHPFDTKKLSFFKWLKNVK